MLVSEEERPRGLGDTDDEVPDTNSLLNHRQIGIFRNHLDDGEDALKQEDHSPNTECKSSWRDYSLVFSRKFRIVREPEDGRSAESDGAIDDKATEVEVVDVVWHLPFYLLLLRSWNADQGSEQRLN